MKRFMLFMMWILFLTLPISNLLSWEGDENRPDPEQLLKRAKELVSGEQLEGKRIVVKEEKKTKEEKENKNNPDFLGACKLLDKINFVAEDAPEDIKDSKNFASNTYFKCALLMFQKNRLAKARSYLKKSIRLGKEDQGRKELRLKIKKLYGLDYLRLKNYEMAVTTLSEYYKEMSDDDDAKLAIAKAYAEWAKERLTAKDRVKAKEYAQKSLKYDPLNKEAKEVLDSLSAYPTIAVIIVLVAVLLFGFGWWYSKKRNDQFDKV